MERVSCVVVVVSLLVESPNVNIMEQVRRMGRQ